MRSDFDAMVIGAGPAGSAAAMFLARAGWSVALVEKRQFPRRKVCGECLAASNWSILDALGVGEAYRAAAGPELKTLALLRADSRVLAALPQGPSEGRPWGRALGRETLDTLLLDQARAVGVTVLQPCAVQRVDGRMGDWRIEARALDARQQHRLRAPVAIAANGSWEALPSGLAHPLPRRRASDLFAFKANFRGAALREGELSVLALEGGYGGMVLADDGLATVACCLRRDRLEACRRAQPGLRAGDAVQAWLVQACQGVRSALAPARRQGPWLAAGPLDPGIRLRADDPMFRIGNAAGEAHPIVGEGMSMALQSAWLLSATLLEGAGQALPSRQGPASAAWQREVALRYAAAWKHQFAPRLRLAATFAQACMRPSSSALLLGLARAWPGLLTQGARWSGKTRDITQGMSTTPGAGAARAAPREPGPTAFTEEQP
jgi:2-polyprenyl-6-methoxyphenol hydroxylase-like FAD-dependent oxidoreductase